MPLIPTIMILLALYIRIVFNKMVMIFDTEEWWMLLNDQFWYQDIFSVWNFILGGQKKWRDFTLHTAHLQRDSLNSFKGCLWRQKKLVTTHIYNISETISDSSVKFWLCFLPLQDMHTRQLQKNIRVSPVWRISRWIIQIQFQ